MNITSFTGIFFRIAVHGQKMPAAAHSAFSGINVTEIRRNFSFHKNKNKCLQS